MDQERRKGKERKEDVGHKIDTVLRKERGFGRVGVNNRKYVC